MMAVAIGIDFGVGVSHVAVLPQNQLIIIPNVHGETTTPSVLARSDKPEAEWIVGKKALSAQSAIYDVRLLIGTKEGDIAVTKYKIKRGNVLWEEGGELRIGTRGRPQESLTVTEAASKILEYLKDSAEKFLRKTVRDVVLTCPEHFDHLQREALTSAASIAGLNVIQLLEEPKAATIICGCELNLVDHQTMLVIHLGVNELEVTVLDYSGVQLDVVAKKRFDDVRQEDVIQALIDHCVEAVLGSSCEVIKAGSEKMNDVRVKCTEAVAELHRDNQVGTTLTVELGDIQVLLTESRMQHIWGCLTTLILQRAQTVQVSRRAGHVVLCGGAVPGMQQCTQQYFPDCTVYSRHPATTIVRGAAVTAAHLSLLKDVASQATTSHVHKTSYSTSSQSHSLLDTQRTMSAPPTSNSDSDTRMSSRKTSETYTGEPKTVTHQVHRWLVESGSQKTGHEREDNDGVKCYARLKQSKTGSGPQSSKYSSENSSSCTAYGKLKTDKVVETQKINFENKKPTPDFEFEKLRIRNPSRNVKTQMAKFETKESESTSEKPRTYGSRTDTKQEDTKTQVETKTSNTPPKEEVKKYPKPSVTGYKTSNETKTKADVLNFPTNNNECKLTPGTAPPVGIDLGMTYSCVCVCTPTGCDVIPNEQGLRTTPSMVAYTEDEGVLVGEAARQQMGLNPSNTVLDAKRLIGRRFWDTAVQQDVAHWPFTVDNQAGRPRVIVVDEGVRRSLSPEEISARVLSKLKKTAQDYLGKPVVDVVVTVPAYFNVAQRDATRQAANLAGLNTLAILNEPTAAAVAYGFDRPTTTPRIVLVYDLGGGTFDVSLLRVKGQQFEVLATAGNNHLGGVDFDNNVVEYFVHEVQMKDHVDIRGMKSSLARLRERCEQAKRHLSTASQVKSTVVVDNLHSGKTFKGTLTRGRFNDLNDSLFQSTLVPLKQVLATAKVSQSDIDDVVLAGGCTRIPYIRTMLETFFDNKPIAEINPDEIVAKGAAICAAALGDTSSTGGNKFNIGDFRLIDVNPPA